MNYDYETREIVSTILTWIFHISSPLVREFLSIDNPRNASVHEDDENETNGMIHENSESLVSAAIL